jgi:dTDP-4-amino-4,6-dideoxygalactose transaminase
MARVFLEKRAGNAPDLSARPLRSAFIGKNLGACGEAGAITTNDAVMATHKNDRDHGQTKKYYHDIEGYRTQFRRDGSR